MKFFTRRIEKEKYYRNHVVQESLIIFNLVQLHKECQKIHILFDYHHQTTYSNGTEWYSSFFLLIKPIFSL